MQYQQRIQQLLKSPYELDEQTLEMLILLTEKYPYCQTLQVLIAKNLQPYDKLQFERHVNKASAYAIDRRRFQRYISDRDRGVSDFDISTLFQTEPETPITSTEEQQPQPINTLFDDEPPVSEEQLIQRFPAIIPHRQPTTPEKASRSLIEALKDKLNKLRFNKKIQQDIPFENLAGTDLLDYEPHADSTDRKATDEQNVKPIDEVIKPEEIEVLTEDLPPVEPINLPGEKPVKEGSAELTIQEEVTPDIDSDTGEETQKDVPVETEYSNENEITAGVENQIVNEIIVPNEQITEPEKPEEEIPTIADKSDTIKITEMLPTESNGIQNNNELLLPPEKPSTKPEKKKPFPGTTGFTEHERAAQKPNITFLIDKFLKEDPRIRVKRDLPEQQEDLSVSSTSEDPQLVTETLAKIFLRQGKKKKALDIYEKLCLKYPEKSSYFAKKILDINNEINN